MCELLKKDHLRTRKSTRWNHKRMFIKPALYFFKRPNRKQGFVMGPASDAKGYLGQAHITPSKEVAGFSGWRQIILTIPGWVWFPLTSSLITQLPETYVGGISAFRTQGPKWTPRHRCAWRREWQRECELPFCPPLFPHTPTPASADITPTLRAFRSTGEMSRRKQKSAKSKRTSW